MLKVRPRREAMSSSLIVDQRSKATEQGGPQFISGLG